MFAERASSHRRPLRTTSVGNALAFQLNPKRKARTLVTLKRVGDGCPNQLFVLQVKLQAKLIRSGARVVDAEIAPHAAAQTIAGEPDVSHSHGALLSERGG